MWPPLHQEGGGSNGQIVTIKRIPDGKWQKSRNIIGERRKVHGREWTLAEHLDGLEKNDFCDFEKSHKRAYQKRKVESNEQSKKGGQRSKNPSLGFVKAIGNRLRNK